MNKSKNEIQLTFAKKEPVKPNKREDSYVDPNRLNPNLFDLSIVKYQQQIRASRSLTISKMLKDLLGAPTFFGPYDHVKMSDWYFPELYLKVEEIRSIEERTLGQTVGFRFKFGGNSKKDLKNLDTIFLTKKISPIYLIARLWIKLDSLGYDCQSTEITQLFGPKKH